MRCFLQINNENKKNIINNHDTAIVGVIIVPGLFLFVVVVVANLQSFALLVIVIPLCSFRCAVVLVAEIRTKNFCALLKLPIRAVNVVTCAFMDVNNE